MWQSFLTLFAGTEGVIAAVCLVIGLAFLTVEIFIPGFGVFGITGTILLLFSLIYRVATSGDILHFLYIIAIIVLVVVISLLIAIRSARFGVLSKTPIIETSTALPEDYASDKKNYGFLINQKGVTKTILKPVGKVDIDNIEYQVITNGDYIDAGVKVKVVEVDGSTIIVRKDEGKK